MDSGLHEVVGVLNSDNATAGRPSLVARSHPLPLTKSESLSLDQILLILGAVFVLVISPRSISPIILFPSFLYHNKLC